MNRIRLLHPRIQAYPWGSRTGIAEFLGHPAPSEQPQAELWLGAHPRAPSEVEIAGSRTSLVEVIRQNPGAVLGPPIAERFDDTMPFLLKVLAADRALSIQAHPDQHQARVGFARENARGIPLDSPQRNYRDPRHKPEILFALRPFWILRGFRPAEEIIRLMRPLGLLDSLPELADPLSAGDLKGFLTAYLLLDAGRVQAAISQALRVIEVDAGDDLHWIHRLAEQFPGDRGTFAPLFLHVLELRPGQAIFTGPGVLHAYLSGVGLELMANSDNVVRGGLTSKHVDVDELLAILRFEATPPCCLSSTVAVGERCFETETGEIALTVIDVTANEPHSRSGDHGVEILLCSQGQGVVNDAGSRVAVTFKQGDALLIPAAIRGYRIEGSARVFRAGVAEVIATGDRSHHRETRVSGERAPN